MNENLQFIHKTKQDRLKFLMTPQKEVMANQNNKTKLRWLQRNV